MKVLENGTLQILSVTAEDDGVYLCDVSNRHGQDNITYDVVVVSECSAVKYADCVSVKA